MLSRLLSLVALLVAPAADAGVYTYRDENGTLQAVSSPDEIPEKFRKGSKALFPKVEAPKNDADVPLRREGNSLIVDVKFGDAGTYPLILDTGAEISVISEEMAAKIKPEIVQTITVSGVTGTAQRPMVKVPVVEVAGFKVRNLHAVVNDMPKSKASGLLGVDFLNHFLMRLDTEAGKLHLERKAK